MTSYIPELSKNTSEGSKVTLTVDRELYDSLKGADCDLHIDLDKVGAVSYLGKICLHRFDGFNSVEYFEDPCRRKELIELFYSLSVSHEAVLDLLKQVEKSIEHVTEFCFRAEEVRS